jgi:hypothetical protein
MKNLLISSIVKAWDKPFMWTGINEFRYKDLAFEIANLSTMLDSLKIKDPRIILSAENSFEWSVVYLTAIIKDIPLTLISPKYPFHERTSYINQCKGNILFIDSTTPLNISKNVFLHAAIAINYLTGYRLILYKKMKGVPKKWRRLNSLENVYISPTLFEKFKEKENKWSNIFSIGVYNAGVNNAPRLHILGDRTLYQASQGMVRKMCKLKLTKQPIYIHSEFNFFSAVTLLAIIGGRGTIVLTMFGERKNKVKGVIGTTRYFEDMWDYLAPFMATKRHMWLEKWQLTKWLNTVTLKKWFREEIPKNCKTFFILNDETRSRLKDNFKRMGYKTFSTYGTAETGQLISIDGQLIRGIEIKFTGLHPSIIPSSLLVQSSNNLLLKTGDVATVGPNSELVIHGKKENKIIIDDTYTIYPEKIERALLSNELVRQAFLYKDYGVLTLAIYLDPVKMDMAKRNFSEGKLLIEQIKDEINNYLPDDVNVSRVIQLCVKLKENEHGKIVRYHYTHTPSLVN